MINLDYPRKWYIHQYVCCTSSRFNKIAHIHIHFFTIYNNNIYLEQILMSISTQHAPSICALIYSQATAQVAVDKSDGRQPTSEVAADKRARLLPRPGPHSLTRHGIITSNREPSCPISHLMARPRRILHICQQILTIFLIWSLM